MEHEYPIGRKRQQKNLSEGLLMEEFTNKNVQLTCEIEEVLNYSIIYNGACVVRNINIKNNSESALEDLMVTITGNSDFVETLEWGIQRIEAGEELEFKNLNLLINADALASLTERTIGRLSICVHQKEQILASDTKEIAILAFDQWAGIIYTPELLAAFSMPNHPVVSSLIQEASTYLEKWTGDPSLAGYQFNDSNRVKYMAAAVYAAIQKKNITYATAPSSFEASGQRIRLVDTVMEQYLGNCMEMTLVYVACLEGMGLNPIMVMKKGHIFAGVWLLDQSFSETVMDDPSQLEKRMSKGIHELLVVECTAMCAGKAKDFDEAVNIAQKEVADYLNFAFVIDVRRARSMGVRPLPIRIKTEHGFEIQHEDRSEEDVTKAPEILDTTFEIPDSTTPVKVTKQAQWERKLLDLSLRNMLINMRMTKAIVPLLASDLGVLEDALSDGEEFQVLARPENMEYSGDGKIPVEALGELGPFKEFIALESKHKKLHSIYTEKELNSCLTKMYRSAKSSMEENGASTLYLALGLLRWCEKGVNVAVRYAPIILIPIDIIRKSANKGYTMRMRDEDAQMNITLLEFLKQNYDLQIYGLNPLPVDEHGVDLPKIFATIRHAVMNLPMWDVVEVGFIGNFSFSQFVMWNDIHAHGEFLEHNKIVHSLIQGAVDWDCTIPESVDTDEAYIPVTVDASQLRAINMAAAGVSFVLHGPPGTGKSQTITAMIANALTKGKKVLFVAEKMAALEVVQKRLTALGIQDFCLELHSNKATKKVVLDQLKKSLEIDVWGIKTDYDKKIQDICKMRKDLDAYATALHTKRAFGRSLRELMDLYEMIPELGYDIRFQQDYAGSLTEYELNQQLNSLERLIAAGKEIGHPHAHPLSIVKKTEYSQRLKFDLSEVIKEYQNVLEQLEKSAISFAEQVKQKKPITGQEWMELCDYARSLIIVDEIPGFLRMSQNIDCEFEKIFAYLKKKKQFDEKQDAIKSLWETNFLRLDMDSFRQKYEAANKKFFGKGKALAALTSEMQAYALFNVETEKIPMYLTNVRFYQQELKEMEANTEEIADAWGELLNTYADEPALQQYRDTLKKQMPVVGKFRNPQEPLDIQNAKQLISDWEVVKTAEVQTMSFLKLQLDPGAENWIETRKQMCTCILENASTIKDKIVYNQFAAECDRLGLGPICDAYEAGMPHEDVIYAYLRAIYRAIILSVIEKEPALNSFTGTEFNEQIAQFKKLDQEFMDLTKEEMFYKLTHQLPTAYESVQVSKELNILRRAISSNGRGISIRTLFEQIPTILPRLCPCMLMSPISAAQYLQTQNDLFDIVIFDEASQLPTCKAVGVLARGKNAVIVGDPNQMPPTSFFAGNSVDGDNLDMEDLDSILDDCLALGMPQSYLHWHYRSRHESLIAFSNKEFYENSMFTFPSVNDREKRVKLVKVNGFFDRGKGRVNEGEAKAIVEEIKRRYQDPYLQNATIGVVTFNISQQTLIEDLLQEECQKNPEFDRWVNTGDEPVFVKNLENVQGDERDVILFSISFGPDENEKLSLNFGPLNRNGGWKRLNVAVSRARAEMIVFTTLLADMIDLRRTKSKGVESLKNFLQFAEKGILQDSYMEKHGHKKEGILERICETIKEAGYTYQKAVGYSKFKVDVAVVNPYNDQEYLLGIMLDGESYRQSSNTKDREVAQIHVLNGLGWKLHRIWTMDWWDNCEKVLETLLMILNEKKEEAYQSSLENSIQPERDVLPEETQIDEENSQETEEVKTETAEIKSIQSEDVSVEKTVAIEVEQKILESIPEVGVLENMPLLNEPEPLNHPRKYQVIEYEMACSNEMELSTTDYVKKENQAVIAQRIQTILDAEAPIEYEKLLKKTLRAFHILRSTSQTLEATEKALKRVSAKSNRQVGIKFYWRKDQNPEQYDVYRNDTSCSDRRSGNEICQQELKNAVCVALKEYGAMEKDELLRATIRAMGYARSSSALLEAAERGLKYGKKTGEILQNKEKKFVLKDNV